MSETVVNSILVSSAVAKPPVIMLDEDGTQQLEAFLLSERAVSSTNN